MDYCNCEITKDEFGGCVLGNDGKTCLACGKLIDKKTLQSIKIRKLKEFGWEKEFEDKLFTNVDTIVFPEELDKLIIKYLNIKESVRVKIKCKDGCIQIERVK